MKKTLNEQIDDVIGDKLDGIQLPPVTYLNAPEDLDSAIERVIELETALEDLERAVEIAIISRQFDLVDGFRSRAAELLVNKIMVQQPENTPMKIAVVDSKNQC